MALLVVTMQFIPSIVSNHYMGCSLIHQECHVENKHLSSIVRMTDHFDFKIRLEFTNQSSVVLVLMHSFVIFFNNYIDPSTQQIISIHAVSTARIHCHPRGSVAYASKILMHNS
jgi:hypothetical protein